MSTTWTAGDWRLDVIVIDHGFGPVQEFRLQHGRILAYSGTDLERVKAALEYDDLTLADLVEQAEQNGERPAAG